MTHNKTPGDLISRKDAAQRAGITVMAVDYWRRNGKIKTYKDGRGHIYVSATEVDALMMIKEVAP